GSRFMVSLPARITGSACSVIRRENMFPRQPRSRLRSLPVTVNSAIAVTLKDRLIIKRTGYRNIRGLLRKRACKTALSVTT
ncbi:cytochrome c-type protein, partial [Calderihabitans maritimus]